MAAATKVLLVEDNLDLLDIIHQFLDAYGFTVFPAKDGQEALDLFEAETPDIVLSDVLLPRINGFQVCERVKKSARPVPVVLMSALYKTHNLQQEAKTKYGADEYLIKPLNLVDVSKLLCRLLGIERPVHAEPVEPEPTPAPGAEEVVGGAVELIPTGQWADLPEAGELADAPPEQLVGYAFRIRATGKLKTTAGGAVRTLYVKNGMPVYATSNVAKEQFSEMLVEDGRVTREQLDDATQAAKELKTTIGKLLVERDLLDNEELTVYLLREVNRRLQAVLDLREGPYVFEADDSWLAKINRPETEVFDLVYQAVTRHTEEAFLRARFADVCNRVVAKNETNLALAGRIQWLENHLEAFAFIDGELTIDGIIAESGQSDFVVFQLLYTLELFDVIRFR